ncbi:MAG: DNA internalization-related competence protein ComEC/Rec2 [Clostridia bacterium]|nr:DNA internalization-related competence protein ComEC/Rec2 [Clostridia bacterium]
MLLKDCGLLTRLIRTRPLFLASLLFLAGCILGYVLEIPALPAMGCALVLLLASALLRKKRAVMAVLLLLAMLPLGAFRFQIAWNATAPLPDQKGALLSGRICELPQYNPDTERTICVLDDISIGGKPTAKKLRLYLRGDPELLQKVEIGQTITCEAHIWRADEATNPGQFNFSNYLRVRGLSGYATAEIESAAFSEQALRIPDYPEIIRSRLGSHVERLFPENAATAKAFLLGDRSELSENQRENYSKSGAAHLLAISGMHISVLAGAVSLLLGRFLSRKKGFFITLIILLAYGALIGFSASLRRAILMFAILGFAPVAGRYSDAPTRLAAALLICLLLRPASILDAGFVLSFGASAGIILLYGPLSNLFHCDAFLHSRITHGLRGIPKRLGKWAVGLTICTFAAQLAILPGVVHYFGAQSIVSFAVNLLVVPLAMFAYIASIIGAASCLAPVAAAGDFLFGLLNAIVEFSAGLPLATLKIARFPAWLVLLCAAACLISSNLSKIKLKIRRFLPLFTVLACLISNGCAYLTTLGCSIVFLDAGQADCAVIRTEGKVYLVDTGDSYSPAADYLSAMNYPVEAVFLSHMHSDHAGGLQEILSVCTPKRVYISANWASYAADDGVNEALEAARTQGCEIIPVSAGDEIQLSKKTLLRVLSPVAGISASAANDDSLVLHVEHEGTSALFTGDAPAGTIAPVSMDADILKVPHHGAADSLNSDFIRAATPSVAIVPVGYNTYGHPAQETIDLLSRAGCQTFRTDRCGAVTCRFDENGRVSVRPYLSSEAANGLE